MVDIGLGPTFGFYYFVANRTKRSPRRVQTDAYHRPCVLNYRPFLSPPLSNSAQRLTRFYLSYFTDVNSKSGIGLSFPVVSIHFPFSHASLYENHARGHRHAAMRVIFMGTPQPVVSTLERLARLPGVQVVAAVTQPDRQGGRGRRSQPTPVKGRPNVLPFPCSSLTPCAPRASGNNCRSWA